MGSRTLARPLALLLAALIAYASLYPFEGWRWPAANPWAFITAPFPRYWSWFDLVSNLMGYVPLGFLTAVAAVRRGVSRGGRWLALAAPALLSLVMESVQVLLPARVPSNVDWALNAVGGLLGGGLALWLVRAGWLVHWQRLRGHWFEPDAHGALILLALWPVALLYPAPLPFGLGQVGWMVQSTVAQAMADTPMAHWLPVVLDEPRPLSPVAQALCMGLMLLAPSLLGFTVLRGGARRLLLLAVVQVLAVAVAGLTAALTYGPLHAWQWLTPPAVLALGLALGVGLLSTRLSRRACVVWLVWVLVAGLALLNRAPATPYFAESLQVWAQGRFIRFHGLTQWVGWLWPYAVMVHAAGHISGRRAASLDTRTPE